MLRLVQEHTDASFGLILGRVELQSDFKDELDMLLTPPDEGLGCGC